MLYALRSRRCTLGGAVVNSLTFIVVLVAVIFAVDAAKRWWRQNAWRWRRDSDDDHNGPLSA